MVVRVPKYTSDGRVPRIIMKRTDNVAKNFPSKTPESVRG